MNPLIGQKVTAVYLLEDGHAIRFHVEGIEEPIVVPTYGDCCSHTWIESIDDPAALLGVVSAVEDLTLREDEEKEGDCTRFYGCKITTDKGAAVIDYRNSSNGYYGGSLSWPGEHEYAGVFGQNTPEGEWRLLAGQDAT